MPADTSDFKCYKSNPFTTWSKSIQRGQGNFMAICQSYDCYRSSVFPNLIMARSAIDQICRLYLHCVTLASLPEPQDRL